MEDKQRQNQELAYWVGFNHLEVSPAVFFKLVKIFGSAKKAWDATGGELEKLDSKLAQKIVEARAKLDAQKLLKDILVKEIKILTIGDKNYPKNLAQIADPPFLLYYKGEIKPEDEVAIGVVGARKMTSYGAQVTENLVSQLASLGITIVSGLARGVDSTAHKVAIEVGGRTIAVLGSGIDVVYPAEHKGLYDKICANGAVFSEFPPGTPPNAWQFPVRNRIIAGLSNGVVVTEAAVDSGSLITARLAAEYNKEVFAVPGPVYSKLSAGTANLIKEGAKLVYEVNDILEELQLGDRVQDLGFRGVHTQAEPDSIDSKILEILANEPKHVDEIVKLSDLPTAQVLSSLSLLEIKGLVKNLGGGVYGSRK